MTSYECVLLSQLILNVVIAVQHIRLKRSCERELTSLHHRCYDLERNKLDIFP